MAVSGDSPLPQPGIKSHEKTEENPKNTPENKNTQISEIVRDAIIKQTTGTQNKSEIEATKQTDSNIEDLPRVSEFFKKELKDAHEKRQLQGIQKSLAQQKHETKLETIKNSQNPVARLEQPFFISYTALQAMEGPKKSEEKSAQEPLGKVYERMTETLFPKGTPISPEAKKIFINTIEFTFKQTQGDGHARLNAVVSALNAKIKKAKNEPERQLLEDFCKKIEGLKQEGIKLTNVPVYYRKADVLRSIGIEMEANDSPDLEKAKQLILKQKGDHLEEAAFKELSQLLPKNVFERLQRNNKDSRYALATDVIRENKNDLKVKELVDKLGESRYVERNFAFKQGLENERELLFGKIFESMGTEKYTLTKSEISLSNVALVANPGLQERLSQQQLESLKSPQGIAGKWLSGERVPNEVWNNYRNAKMALARAGFQKLPEQEISELRKRVAECAEKVCQYGGANSVAYHCVNDLIICQGDGHWEQYLSENNEFLTYDVARGLPPSNCIKVLNDTFAMLKSDMLGHPLAEQPMPPDLISQILSWDLNKLEKDDLAKGRVSTSKEFDALKEKWNEIQKDSNKRTDITQVQAFCKKYKIPFENDESMIELTEKMDKFLDKEIVNLKTLAFKKIHPKAYEELKIRRQKLLEYVRMANPPTPKGAFEVMYPHLVPFVRVLERMETNPYMAIAGHLVPVSLGDIIAKAKKEGVADESEIKAMQDILAELSKQPVDRDLAFTTLGMVFKGF